MRNRFRKAVVICAALAAISTGAIAEDGHAEEDSHRPVRVGILVGPSLPTPANVEVLVKLFDIFGIGGSYGVLPHQLSLAALSALSLRDTSVDAWSGDVDARVFPFRGAFFLGAALGEQRVAVAVAGNEGRSAVAVKTRYVTPRLGWLGTWGPGFSVSFDLGAQLPLTTDVTVSGISPQSGILGTVSQYAHVPQPSMNLKVGWVF
jgi:hypothetical protein